MDNIEKSPFHKDTYIGHAFGVWDIREVNAPAGKWQAQHRHKLYLSPIYADTLQDMSTKLHNLKPEDVEGKITPASPPVDDTETDLWTEYEHLMWTL